MGRRGPKPSGARWSKDQYCTPPEACEAVYEFFSGEPELDPAWDPESPMRAMKTFALSRGEDGLAESWKPYRTIFNNMPYSGPAPWIGKWFERLACGEPCEILGLVPLTPGVRWFANLKDSPFVKAYASPCPRRLAFLKQGKPDKSPRGETTLVYATTREQEIDFDLRERLEDFHAAFHELFGLITVPFRPKGKRQ